MNGDDLIKFLRKIGVPLSSKIKPDSLDNYMKDKSSRAFIVGICRSFSSKNVIVDKEIENQDWTTLEPNLDQSAADVNIDLHNLADKVRDTEHYLKLLEEENSRLLDSIKCLSNCNSKSENLLTKLCNVKENMLSKCKGNIASTKKDSQILKESCIELYNLTCKNDTDPLLLYHLPLDTYRADKNAFENHIKTYIIKQFQEKMAELAGENQPPTCDQKNPRELEHLVSGPDRDLYNQQRRQLDQLEISFAESLYVTVVQEAKIAGLEAGIKKAKQLKENSAMQRHFNARLNQDTIQLGEKRVYSAAKECVARRIGMLVIGNFAVKQRRQNYYLEKLNVLENMLQKQIALDKLLCIFLQLEGAMVSEACSFMENTQQVLTEQVNSNSIVLSSMDECKFRNMCNGSEKYDEKLNQFLQCLLPELANINETDCSDILIIESLLQNRLQNYELQLLHYKRSDLQEDVNHNNNVWKLMCNLKEDKLKTNFKRHNLKHHLDLQLKEFYIDLERQKQCRPLQQYNNLWAQFIVSPESLTH